MPLEPEGQKHLTAAQGYLELGMFLDANAELDEIDPDERNADIHEWHGVEFALEMRDE